MIEDRIDLQSALESLMISAGYEKHVYFQPPENVKIIYPAIVYKRKILISKPADNLKYLHNTQYEVTLIDKNPETPMLSLMYHLSPEVRYSNNFVSENLNHDVFTIYTRK